MADPIDTPELPELPDPAFAPPDAVAPAAPEPQESEPDEEIEPPAPPPENREAMLARENAQLRELLLRPQPSYAAPPQAQAPSDPYANYLRGIPEAQQGPWRESLRVLDPIVRQMMMEVVTPLQEEVRVARGVSESLSLAERRNPSGGLQYPEYRSVAHIVEQARYQHYLNTQGREWQPLEMVYLVLKGQGAFDGLTPTPKQERTKARRAQAARVPVATTAEPQQAAARMPAPKRTVEQTMAMSDDAMRDLATKNGIEWPGPPSRKRVA